MSRNKLVACFDLEGPITILDFAAELGKNLNKKLGLNLLEYNMAEFFTMISNYDDYIIDIPGVKEQLNLQEYQYYHDVKSDVRLAGLFCRMLFH